MNWLRQEWRLLSVKRYAPLTWRGLWERGRFALWLYCLCLCVPAFLLITDALFFQGDYAEFAIGLSLILIAGILLWVLVCRFGMKDVI
jgi:hypothetical protein